MPFVVGVVLSCEPVNGKANLKQTSMDIGDAEGPITIVTNAPNIREGTRTVVATIGSTIEMDGESITVAKRNVGGVLSSGIVCDSLILGWVGGGAGTAVQVPPSFSPGDEAPSSKPRMDGGTTISTEPEKSDKERKAEEKARKKAELAKRREEMKAKKAAKKVVEGGDREGEEEAAAATTTTGDEASEQLEGLKIS